MNTVQMLHNQEKQVITDKMMKTGGRKQKLMELAEKSIQE